MSGWRTKTNQAPQPSIHSRGQWRGRGRSAPRSAQANNGTPPMRQMEHIATVSRSSGLEKDGDTLKDFALQEEYRIFLQGKVDDLVKRHPRRTTESEQEARQRIDAQENILILFRKLREGIYSSRRTDTFALEVYETSLYLSVIFNSSKQTTSIIPHLLPNLYLNTTSPHHNCHATILVALIHHLVAAYPSQSSFDQYLSAIPASLLPTTSHTSRWINALSQSLRTRNYIKFEELTRRSTITQLFGDTGAAMPAQLSQSNRHESLPQQALYELANSLRSKIRETSWNIIRSAYRELSCGANSGTGDWLSRSLCLQPIISHAVSIDAEQWLKQQIPLGHVRQKEGDVGKWIICKIR